ncbi:MAG TPA: hypothetical protein VHQ65_03080 [Thermoanaerobaculia bacterium]|nr:hypothetical protein [Thermoanaerobaculia bacterium]
MRRPIIALAAATLLLLAAGGCSGDRVEQSEGSVILSVTDFDGLPVRVSVNTLDLLQVEEVVISNIPKDPQGNTSALMDVEMQTYEVTYSRGDQGTRVPTSMVRRIFGVAPAGGDITYDNLVVMSAEQFLNPPLSDLLFAGGGIDTETGSPVILIEFTMRFFGRTLSGDSVATAPVRFDVEFVP